MSDLFKQFKKTRSKSDQAEYEKSVRHKDSGKSGLRSNWIEELIPPDIDLEEDILLNPSFIEPDNDILMAVLENLGPVIKSKYEKSDPEGKMDLADRILSGFMSQESMRNEMLDKSKKWLQPGQELSEFDLNMLNLPEEAADMEETEELDKQTRPADKPNPNILIIAMSQLEEDEG